jgi:hypothetical protein
MNLIYFIIFVCRKSLPADPSKKIAQFAPSYATPVAPFAGVTGSTALSAAEAWNFHQRTTKFLEGLKNRDADQQGNLFTPSLFFLLISLADLRPSLFVVLANDLRPAQRTLSDEKFARLGVENSLAEEKTSRQAAEQSLQQFKDANTILALELEKPISLLLLLVTNWIVSQKS